MTGADGETTPARRRRWLRPALHVAVTVAVCVVLVLRVDLAEVWTHVLAAGIAELAIALLLSTLVFVLITRRWQILLRLDGAPAPFGPLLVTYVESAFFSLFLPSAVGGDVFLGARVREQIGGVRRAAVNLVTARIIGLWAVCLLAAASLPATTATTARLRAAVAITCALVVAASALLVSRRVQTLVTAVLRRLRLTRVAAFHALLVKQFHDYLRPAALVEMMIISVAQQVLAIGSVYFVGRAAGLDLDLWFFMFVMPVVWLLGLVPSLGGVGPREAGLAYVIVEAGGTHEQAVATAGLTVAVMVARALLGGAVWVAGVGRRARVRRDATP